jgi:hypothetical protein
LPCSFCSVNNAFSFSAFALRNGIFKNPESYADFNPEGIFEKKCTGKKLDPKNVFFWGYRIFVVEKTCI